MIHIPSLVIGLVIASFVGGVSAAVRTAVNFIIAKIKARFKR